MADDTQDLTVEVLRSIRDEITGLRADTNARFAELRTETNASIAQTNARLDFLADGQVRLATEVAGLRGDVHDLRGEVHDLRGEVHDLRGGLTDLTKVVEKNGQRFEHFLATEGDVIRDLRRRIERVESHVGLNE
jgi:chromosome segregation ATPase